MKSYTPPSDSDGDGSDEDNGKKPKAKRPKKDPNAPKRPMNAYMLFSNAMRAKVKAENPEFKMGDIVSVYHACSQTTSLTTMLILTLLWLILDSQGQRDGQKI